MSTSLMRRLGLAGALALLTSPMAALATPYRWQVAPLAPPPVRTAYGPGYGGAYPPPLRQPLPPARPLERATVDPYAYGDRYSGADRYAYGDRYGSSPVPTDPALLEAQLAQRCNIGRLVGGLMGGGLGYAASRQDGRSWAVPLGALLGQQMGCSVGAGRTPLPW
jgi:hypothetical protein